MAMPAPPPGAGMPPMQFPPGQRPSPEQIAMMQQQFAQEAAKQGLTPQQFAEKLRAHAMAQRAAQMQAQQAQGQIPAQAPSQPPPQQGQIPPPGAGAAPQQGQPQQMAARPGQQVPITPGPPKPEALAVAKFLRAQDLKSRPCIFQEKRKDLFKVKRAIRALRSPAYEKARSKKNSLLPPITDRASAENVFKLLPISMLALRVSKIDANANPAHGEPGHQHGGGGAKTKGGKKGLWNVRIEQQQEAADDFHYIWFYEGSQWRQKVYAVGALLGVIAVVLFPLWPYFLRKAVWYLSMGALGLLGLFFGLAIVRLILFLATIAVGPKPGIWLYPNLFEDVGFFDSFKPVWAWRETKESLALKKAAKKSKKQEKRRKAGATAATGPQTDAAGNRVVEDVTEEVDEEGGDEVDESGEEDVEEVAGVGNGGVADGVATGIDRGEGLVQRKGLQARVEEEED